MPLPKWQRRLIARQQAGLERGGVLTEKGEAEAEELHDPYDGPFEEPDGYGDYGYDPGDDLPA